MAATDEEILEAYQLLASTEGIFAEPASCASIAGIKKQVENGMLQKGSTVVAILTGNGLKDPETAISVNEHKALLVPEDMESFWEDLKKGVKA